MAHECVPRRGSSSRAVGRRNASSDLGRDFSEETDNPLVPVSAPDNTRNADAPSSRAAVLRSGSVAARRPGAASGRS